MNDPWEKAYVYGKAWRGSKIAHIVAFRWWDAAKALCGRNTLHQNHTPDPYPVCKNCLRTKRAKELGL